MAEPAEIGKYRRPPRSRRARPEQARFQVIPGAYGSSEINLAISASVQPRTVRVRTFPSAPLIMAILAMLSPFAVSTMIKRSDSPEVRKTCLISTPSFLASSRAAWRRLGASLTRGCPGRSSSRADECHGRLLSSTIRNGAGTLRKQSPRASARREHHHHWRRLTRRQNHNDLAALEARFLLDLGDLRGVALDAVHGLASRLPFLLACRATFAHALYHGSCYLRFLASSSNETNPGLPRPLYARRMDSSRHLAHPRRRPSPAFRCRHAVGC